MTDHPEKIATTTTTHYAVEDQEEQARYDAEYQERKRSPMVAAAEAFGDEVRRKRAAEELEAREREPRADEVEEDMRREASSSDVRARFASALLGGRQAGKRAALAHLLSAEAAAVEGSFQDVRIIPAGELLVNDGLRRRGGPIPPRGAPLYPHPDVEGPPDDDEPSDHAVVESLRDLADLFQDRYEQYGENYKRFGDIMRALFPDGRLVIEDQVDFTRLGLFVQMVYKMSRYASRFNFGGHRDSLDDLSVYSQMLAEIDEEDGI